MFKDETSGEQEYPEFIKTLYDTRKPLFAGMVGHVLCLFLIYWSTAHLPYLVGSLAMVTIWALRNHDMHKFDHVEVAALDGKTARRWEIRYIVGSASATFTLGFLAGYSLYLNESLLASSVTMALGMSTLVAVVGRNFGSKANIDIISGLATFPMAAGMLLSGSHYMAICGLAFLPMFFSTREMANGIRTILHKAFLSKRQFRVIADQFEAALNNMPHGLFMFDTDDRVTVANEKAARLLGFGPETDLAGHTVKAMLRLGMARGRISKTTGQAMTLQFAKLMRGESRHEIIEMDGEKFFDVSAKVRQSSGVVMNFEDVTARVRASREMYRLARYDALSGLPNRTYMPDLISEAVAKMNDGQTVVFSVFDIDRFKQINDTMGHGAGDRVIHQIGQRMAAIEDGRVTCARLGGDEFVLAVVGVEPGEDVASLLDRLYGGLTGVYMIGGKRMEVMVSGGVIVYPRQEFKLDEALIKADLALYESKRSETTTWTLFAQDMDNMFREKQMLKKELQKALAEGGLSAAYQPMLTMDGLNIECCEALARWEHPELGTIPPARFIPVAEEMGVVGEVTRHILAAACRDCMSWPETMSVSVNLSAIDLANPEIVGVIRAALEGSGLAPERLQVEITESTLVKDSKKTASIMAAVREMGVRTALDDFGTGYSSLSYLNELPLDKVKIDRSFVDKIVFDDKARHFLGAMIRLAKDLGFEIVVEGIETETQLDILRKIGSVDLVQGYVFGKPMPPASIPTFVTNVSLKQLQSARILRLVPGERAKA